MEYHKIINFLDNTSNQLTKFRTKNWIEINDNACGTYNTNIQVKFKTPMLKSSLCDYSDVYILASGTKAAAALVTGRGNNNKKVTFKIFAPFTDFISEISNTQVENAKDIDLVTPMYNLIEYSDNDLKTSGSLW